MHSNSKSKASNLPNSLEIAINCVGELECALPSFLAGFLENSPKFEGW